MPDMPYSLPTATDLRITPEPADSTPAGALLERYYDELAARFPGGPGEFDLPLIATSTTEFTPPDGVFLLPRLNRRAVGCAAVRRVDAANADIKRLWGDPAVRGLGIGRSLLAAVESAVTELGGRTVRLDTAAHLTEALPLYRSAGYAEIAPYNENPYAAQVLETPALMSQRSGAQHVVRDQLVRTAKSSFPWR